MINIPSWAQSDESLCGPAVVKMVMAYYGFDAPENEIAERCGHTYEFGCTDFGMKRAFESYGFNVAIYNECTLHDLRKAVKQKIPVIVDWFSPGVQPAPEIMPYGHSSIVVDIDKENIWLMDPENGKVRKLRCMEFIRVWFDWKNEQYITAHNLVLRQMMIARPITYRGPRYRIRT